MEQKEVIEKAREIKSRKKRIAFIYDSACDILDKQFEGQNVCGFKNAKCYTQYNSDNINGCCRKCIYQSKKGCQTKNLTCKLFYCGEVTKRCKVLKFEDLEILKILSLRQRLILKHDYFASREEVLKDLEIGSLIIFILRFIMRSLKRLS